MSDEGRRLMAQNKLSIHVETETGDIFYDNHNTEENFYNILLLQQNDEAAEVPKKFSYSNSFEKYITEFFKNSKYLFYVFNSFVRLYGNSRYKLLHTRVMKDSVALEKIADKNKQFLVEKLIQGVEFESGYENSLEKKPLDKEAMEGNYKVAGRVYQQLFYDIAELFQEYVQSIDLYEQQDIEEDLKSAEWGILENIRTIKDPMRLMGLFQDFYSYTGRLPNFNELLVVPDGDAPPQEKLNLKHMYDLFKNTNSHGVVSIPFLGLLFHYFHQQDKLRLVRHATTELYKNLSYTMLSGSRPLQFNAISDLIGELSFSIKSFTVQNQRNKEAQMQKIAKVFNDGRIFNPIVNDPLDDLETQPNPEHKKTTFPYVEPTVQLPDEIENVRQQDNKDHTDLMDKIYRHQDFVTKTRKDKELGEVIEDTVQPTWDDYWREDDVFDDTDTRPTTDQSKKILDDVKWETPSWETPTSTEPLHHVNINALATNILKNIRSVDNRTP